MGKFPYIFLSEHVSTCPFCFSSLLLITLIPGFLKYSRTFPGSKNADSDGDSEPFRHPVVFVLGRKILLNPWHFSKPLSGKIGFCRKRLRNCELKKIMRAKILPTLPWAYKIQMLRQDRPIFCHAAEAKGQGEIGRKY